MDEEKMPSDLLWLVLGVFHPVLYLFIYVFIYIIIEAKQSNAISKNHNERVIIVSAAKADKG